MTVAKKRKPSLMHRLLFAGRAEADEAAPTFYLGGVPYCWTPERGRFPRPPGWGTRGKVYIGIDPDEVFGPARVAP